MVQKNESLQELKKTAREIRRHCVNMFKLTGHGHFGGSFSCVEIVTALYFSIMRVDPNKPQWPDRDRFIISKGHGAPAVYGALVEKGYFSRKWMDEYELLGSNLNTHPNMLKVPGIDMSSGSLGHGLSVGVGMALAGKLNAKDYTTFVLIGDGETNEGAIWEAAMSAGRFKLDNLIAITDRNMLCAAGCTEDIMPIEPLDKKWESFGWDVQTIDGHDFVQIIDAVHKALGHKNEKPKMIIARTIKGKGVSFMENAKEWHGHSVSDEQFFTIMNELEDD